MIGTIAVTVIVNEVTTDTLTITKQPIQQGASITDHAYLEPTSFSHTILYAYNSNVSLTKMYQQFLTLQASAIPFDIVTPKRMYRNMLLGVLTQTTDKLTENCLSIHATYQSIIIVPLSTVQVDPSNQKNAAATQATQNGGQKSALLNLVGGPGVQGPTP